MIPAFYLIIAVLVPGVTPKAEDAQLSVSIKVVNACPNKDALKASYEDRVKTGEILRFDITCARTFIPTGGQPA